MTWRRTCHAIIWTSAGILYLDNWEQNATKFANQNAMVFIHKNGFGNVDYKITGEFLLPDVFILSANTCCPRWASGVDWGVMRQCRRQLCFKVIFDKLGCSNLHTSIISLVSFVDIRRWVNSVCIRKCVSDVQIVRAQNLSITLSVTYINISFQIPILRYSVI